MTDEKLYNIGEVVAALRSEFPDVTASSLRFLEHQGLLSPKRSPGAHRLYSGQDVARIRLIKRLQSERYYPLDIIRPLLSKLERAQDVDAEMRFLESLYRPQTYDPGFVPLSRRDLAARTGLTSADIARLEEMSLLLPQTSGEGQRYDEDDLKVAELVARELRLGARVRDFVRYATAMRALVQEEFNLFRTLTGTDKPSPERVRELRETAEMVHALVRAKLTRQMVVRIKHGDAAGWRSERPKRKRLAVR